MSCRPSRSAPPLGAAPGPVQLLILNETARYGIGQGFRVMLGANGMLFFVLATLALGFSTVEPSPELVRGLRIVGGGFLVYIAVNELRGLRRESVGAPTVEPTSSRLGPSVRGVVLVIVNPGAWIFFATTAAAVMAEASADGGRDVALLTAVAMTLGVSLTDFRIGPGRHRQPGARRTGAPVGEGRAVGVAARDRGRVRGAGGGG